MKRIYLDQNMWIELSRARLAVASAKNSFCDAYQLARYAAAHGLASFVLSQTHMYETQKSQRWDRRLDIVETMIELSRFHAIKHVTCVVPLEASFAIQSLAGLGPAQPNVFGQGVRAILSKPIDLQDGDLLDLTALGYRESFVRIANSLGPSRRWDAVLLAGPPPDTVAEGLIADLKSVDNAFADDQAGVAAKIKSLSIKGAQLEEALTHYTLLEVKHELFRAAEGCGISPEAVADMMIKSPTAVMRILPSRHVVHAMYLQHAQSQKRWKPNDLHDITALGVAVPYCDAVATERHWVSMLRRRGLDSHYGTTLIASPEELLEYLTGL